jgi:hypothetical protein
LENIMSKTHLVISTMSDLHDYVSEIPSAYVAAHVASSTAWKIDAMISGAARTIFKAVRQELFDTGVDAMAELDIALAQVTYAEKSFAEIGFTQNGPVETIRALNSQRDQWHDLAYELTSLTSDYNGVPKSYIIPTLDNVFFGKKTMKVNAETMLKMRASAKAQAVAFGSPEKADMVYQRQLEAANMGMDSMARTLTGQAGACHAMCMLTLRGDDESAASRSKEFKALPIDCQRALLNNAMSAAAMADTKAIGDHSISGNEHALILLCNSKLNDDIRATLRSPRFVIDDAVHNSPESGAVPTYKTATQIKAIRESADAATF